MPRTSILAVTSSLALVLAAGCDKIGDLGQLTDGASSSEPSSEPSSGATEPGDPTMTGDPTAGPSDTDEPTTTGGPLAPADGVDILFIIDNSGSMAAHQQRLADAIPALVDPLIAAGRDLRIAVTTTDAGNPRCPNTTPENGRFQARSCREGVALNEWQYGVDDFAAACLGVCAKETLVFSPTITAVDPMAKVRPWVEWDGVTGNVAASLNQALGCMLPQGVAGCGFESPLESLRLALERARTPGDPQFGFLRANADLLVVMVSDEVDCSLNPVFKEIFIGNTVFWGPDDPQPSSGSCWRAGVTCSGGPGTYEDCVATDHDVSGMITGDPAQAVLFPVSRYQDALAEIRAEKLAAGSAAQVRVAAIAGVPVGYPQTPLVFADSPDPELNSLFGIGPGCVAGDGATAVPPVRLLELIEDSSPPGVGLFSICEDSFQSTLAAMSAALMGG